MPASPDRSEIGDISPGYADQEGNVAIIADFRVLFELDLDILGGGEELV